jgi:hypothetical protein
MKNGSNVFFSISTTIIISKYFCTFFFYYRCACLDNNQAQQMSTQWTLDMDTALVQYINSFAKKLGVAPSRLHPHEIRIPEEILTNETYACLQGKIIYNNQLVLSCNLSYKHPALRS